MSKKIIFSSLLFLLSFSVYANTENKIIQYAHQWQQKNHMPALSLYIVSPKNHIEILSGNNKIKDGKPITSDMLFGVGSITKTFVSVTILKLEEEGKLKLSDKLEKYFPQYKKWGNVTIKEMLNMTSGIPNASENKTVQKNYETKVQPGYTTEKQIHIAYQLPINFKPGQGWSYSNTGYSLLGKIIEKITGKPLLTVFQEKIFDPYGLSHTIFSDHSYSDAQIKTMVHGYNGNMDVTDMKPSNLGAAGAAFMNAADLVKWINALLIEKKVLAPKELKQFLTFVPVPVGINQPAHQYYGSAIFMLQTKQYGDIYSYAGVTFGYSSTFVWVPKKHILLVAQINHITQNKYNYLFSNSPLVRHILKILCEKNEVK